jgi:hypothetical protein
MKNLPVLVEYFLNVRTQKRLLSGIKNILDSPPTLMVPALIGLKIQME